jgi:hypothetical protein
MRARATIITLALAGAGLLSTGTAPAHAQEEPSICVWGGTPAAPTGTFTIEPGIRTTPAPFPLKLKATGPAEGDACKSTVTFEGVVRAGSTCAVLHFEGRVRGVPGVETFWGPGSPVAHEFLYDGAGNLVGFNNPTVVNQDLVEGIVESPDSCNSPEGFTHGRFSSTIELFGSSGTAAP